MADTLIVASGMEPRIPWDHADLGLCPWSVILEITVSEALCSLEYRTIDKVRNPVIAKGVRHRHHTLESIKISFLRKQLFGRFS
jgi:hypothetical protein